MIKIIITPTSGADWLVIPRLQRQLLPPAPSTLLLESLFWSSWSSVDLSFWLSWSSHLCFRIIEHRWHCALLTLAQTFTSIQQLENPCAIHIIVCIQTQLVFSISRKVVEDMERSSKKYRVMRVRNIETCKPLQLDIQAPPTVPRGYIGTRASQNGFLFIASFPRQRKQGKARAVFALGTSG